MNHRSLAKQTEIYAQIRVLRESLIQQGTTRCTHFSISYLTLFALLIKFQKAISSECYIDMLLINLAALITNIFQFFKRSLGELR